MSITDALKEYDVIINDGVYITISVRLEDLAEDLGCSVMQVRKRLQAMCREGTVARYSVNSVTMLNFGQPKSLDLSELLARAAQNPNTDEYTVLGIFQEIRKNRKS